MVKLDRPYDDMIAFVLSLVANLPFTLKEEFYENFHCVKEIGATPRQMKHLIRFLKIKI